jgi:hypothetical protein
MGSWEEGGYVRPGFACPSQPQVYSARKRVRFAPSKGAERPASVLHVLLPMSDTLVRALCAEVVPSRGLGRGRLPMPSLSRMAVPGLPGGLRGKRCL